MRLLTAAADAPVHVLHGTPRVCKSAHAASTGLRGAVCRVLGFEKFWTLKL